MRQRIFKRGVLLALATGMIGLAARGHSAEDDSPKLTPQQQREERERQNIKKAVEAKLGKKEDGFFVVGLSSTVFSGRGRQPIGRGGRNTAGLPTQLVPSTYVRVETAEGRSAAAELIIQFMSQPRAMNAGQPAVLDWRFLGRYEKEDDAKKAQAQARAQFNR